MGPREIPILKKNSQIVSIYRDGEIDYIQVEDEGANIELMKQQHLEKLSTCELYRAVHALKVKKIKDYLVMRERVAREYTSSRALVCEEAMKVRMLRDENLKIITEAQFMKDQINEAK